MYNMRRGMKENRQNLPATSQPTIKLGKTATAVDQLFWVDFFCLRQCQNDFDVEKIGNLIMDIKCTLLEVDHELEYTRRSFCLIEAFFSVQYGAKLLCVIPNKLLEENMKQELDRMPINVEA